MLTNEIIRRRSQMVGKPAPFVINATDNPKYMGLFYNAGWCASPDGMTAKECAAVTQQQMDKILYFGGRVGAAKEPMPDLSHFKKITSLPYEAFAYTLNTGIAYCPPNLRSTKERAFRRTRCSRYYFPASFNSIGTGISIDTTGIWIFNSMVPPSGLSSNISNMTEVYCPDNALAAYQDAAGDYANKVKPISELTNV